MERRRSTGDGVRMLHDAVECDSNVAEDNLNGQDGPSGHDKTAESDLENVGLEAHGFSNHTHVYCGKQAGLLPEMRQACASCVRRKSSLSGALKRS